MFQSPTEDQRWFCQVNVDGFFDSPLKPVGAQTWLSKECPVSFLPFLPSLPSFPFCVLVKEPTYREHVIRSTTNPLVCKLSLRIGSEVLFTELNEYYVSINNSWMSLIYEHNRCNGDV